MRNRLADSGILDAVPDEDIGATTTNVPTSPSSGESSSVSSRPVSESIAGWLDIAIKLCRLKEREASSLREELESHLSERVNDMLVTGANEQQAIRRAIAELGDAAIFAQQYRTQRNEPTRRKIMNGLLIGSVGAALALSVTAITINQPTRGPNVYPTGTAYIASGAVDDLIDFSFKDVPLREILTEVGSVVADRVYINEYNGWDNMLDSKLTLVVGEVAFSHGLLLLSEKIRAFTGEEIEYRVTNGLIEFGPRSLFDTREKILVSYDFEEDLRPDVTHADLKGAITSLVEFDSWVDNGGEAATITIVGSLLFINASPRIHEGVEWVIGQLSEASQEDTTEDQEDSNE